MSQYGEFEYWLGIRGYEGIIGNFLGVILQLCKKISPFFARTLKYLRANGMMSKICFKITQHLSLQKRKKDSNYSKMSVIVESGMIGLIFSSVIMKSVMS